MKSTNESPHPLSLFDNENRRFKAVFLCQNDTYFRPKIQWLRFYNLLFLRVLVFFGILRIFRRVLEFLFN